MTPAAQLDTPHNGEHDRSIPPINPTTTDGQNKPDPARRILEPVQPGRPPSMRTLRPRQPTEARQAHAVTLESVTLEVPQPWRRRRPKAESVTRREAP